MELDYVVEASGHGSGFVRDNSKPKTLEQAVGEALHWELHACSVGGRARIVQLSTGRIIDLPPKLGKDQLAEAIENVRMGFAIKKDAAYFFSAGFTRSLLGSMKVSFAWMLFMQRMDSYRGVEISDQLKSIIQDDITAKVNKIFDDLLENDGNSQVEEIVTKVATALCEEYISATKNYLPGTKKTPEKKEAHGS